MIWFNYMFKIVAIDPGSVMSDLDHSDFADVDHVMTTIRAAVRYLLRGTTDGVRGDILQGIITMVRKAASEPSPGQPNPFDDDAPGG